MYQPGGARWVVWGDDPQLSVGLGPDGQVDQPLAARACASLARTDTTSSCSSVGVKNTADWQHQGP
jgi:hypothetical protein